MLVLGNILSFISYFIYWLGPLCKEKKNFLIFTTIGYFIGSISFLLLNSFAGIGNQFFAIGRNLICLKLKDSSMKIKMLFYIILLIVFISMIWLTWNGISSIFVFLCGMINLFANMFLPLQKIRITSSVASIMYIGYQFFIQNYLGTMCEFITFGILIGSYIKYKNHNIDPPFSNWRDNN